MCRAHPRIVFGAASLLMVVALLPSLLQLLLAAALQPSATARLVLQALFSVVSLIVFPPLVGGFYRLAHALHQGRPASPLDLFAMFRDTGAARQLIVTNLQLHPDLDRVAGRAGARFRWRGPARIPARHGHAATRRNRVAAIPRWPDVADGRAADRGAGDHDRAGLGDRPDRGDGDAALCGDRRRLRRGLAQCRRVPAVLPAAGRACPGGGAGFHPGGGAGRGDVERDQPDAGGGIGGAVEPAAGPAGVCA